jgi:4-hydroxy 2-oxovalerate aldolase
MKVNVLDCTLREAPIEGLLIGKNYIDKFIRGLERANIDIIECGFLKNSDYAEGSSIFNKVEDIRPYLKQKKHGVIYTALVDYGRYDLKHLSDYDGSSIDGIRICFKKGEQKQVIKYARAIKDKGYKIFIQHVDTLGYSDSEILDFISMVNELKPYSYSIVDTFGSMYANDVRRIYDIANHNLDKSIKLGFHAHNNLMLAVANTQMFVFLSDENKEREITVDCSILGCGRGAGNANTELVVSFLNSQYNGAYDLNELLDIIDFLMPAFQQKSSWGYSIPYFLSGIHGAHVFNVNHLLKRHNILFKDLRAIIGKIDDKQKKLYDYSLLEKLYVEHFNHSVDDIAAKRHLKNIFKNKKLLCLGPSNALNTERNKIADFICKEKPIIIGINNFIKDYPLDFIFFSGISRYSSFCQLHEKKNIGLITTSNIKSRANHNELIINYLPLIKFGWVNIDSSAVLLLRLLINLEVKNIYFAGFDGFGKSKNYYNDELKTNMNEKDLLLLTKETKEMLADMKQSVKVKDIKIKFITKSQYSDIFQA